MKFKAVPYIQISTPNKKFREFLLRPFEIDNLYDFNGESNVLFIDWKGKDMVGWHKLINIQSGVMLEIFTDEYKIHYNKKITVFPYPKNINQFISDCYRMDVILYWNIEKMDKHFDLKTYVLSDEARIYYKELLIKIGKKDVF